MGKNIITSHHYFSETKTYKDNLTFFRIINTKTKNDLGIIRFSYMIPLLQESVYLLDMKSKSYGYKRLLLEQNIV